MAIHLAALSTVIVCHMSTQHLVQVDELQNRMILSQKQVLQAELLKKIKVGSVVEVRIDAPLLILLCMYRVS